MSLIVVHRDKGIETLPAEHEISAGRSLDIETGFPQTPGPRNDDPVIIVAEQPPFPGVGIDPEQADARPLDLHPLRTGLAGVRRASPHFRPEPRPTAGQDIS